MRKFPRTAKLDISAILDVRALHIVTFKLRWISQQHLIDKHYTKLMYNKDADITIYDS